MSSDTFAVDPLAAGERRRGLDRQRRLTLMSVDIVDSTPLAERLDPERLRDVILSYHDVCDKAVSRYDGRIGARQGDGLMAHFGLSNPHEDDARRATLAGLAILEALVPLTSRLRDLDGVELQVRIGVHTGEVVITELGGHAEIVGRTPNETARLESAATPGTVAVSAATYELISDDFLFDEPHEVTLRGVKTPMTIYTVRGVAARAVRLRALIPFVGRQDARRRLAALWNRTRDVGSGSGASAAFILGEAGYGKSRLAHHTANLAVRDGAAKIVLNARAYDTAVPFHPFATALVESFELDLLDSADDRYARLGEGLAALGVGQAAPHLAQLLDLGAHRLGEAAGIEPSVLGPAIIDGLLQWLRARARQQPLIILAEDLHWADPSTVQTITRLISEPVPGLFVLATARKEFANPWSPDIVETIELGVLEEGDIARLVGLLDNGIGLTDEQLAQLVDRSDGVPLYLDRLVDLTRRESSLLNRGIPNGLDQLLTTVLEAPGVDQTFVGLLAAIGRNFEAEFVADACGDDEANAVVRLEALCEKGILERSSWADRPAYGFHHALMQSAAYEHQLASDRRIAHVRIAEAIERRGSTSRFDVATVARHLDNGGRTMEAIPTFLEASVSAHRKGATAEARRHIDRALELLANAAPGNERDTLEVDLQLHLAVCLTSTEGFGSPNAAAASERALAICENLNRDWHFLRVMTDLFSFHTVRGERAVAAEIIQRARQHAETDRRAKVVIDQLEALHHVALGELRRSQAMYLSVVGSLEEEERQSRDDPFEYTTDSLSAAYTQLAPLHWQFGDAEGAGEWLEKAIKRARTFDGAKGAFGEAHARTWECYLKVQAGDHSAALETAREMGRFCTRKGLAMWGGFATMYETVAAANLAPTAATEAMLGLMVDMLQGMGIATMTSYFMSQHAQLLHALGRPGEAIDRLTLAIAVAERNVELQELPETYRLRGRARQAVGDDAAAADDFLAAASLARQQGATIYAIRALNDLIGCTDPTTETRPPSTTSVVLAELVSSVATPSSYPEVAVARRLLERGEIAAP